MSEQSPQVVNAAGYLFTPLTNPNSLRPSVRQFCAELQLRGTVTLSPEGVNCGVAGSQESIATFTARLPELLGVQAIPFKYSRSDAPPFDRMLVKVKPRLLPIEDLTWDETVSSTTQLPGSTLRQWLDEGRDIVLLDTRNDYEFDVGSFEGAVPLPITNFRSFETEARARLPEWQGKTIVTFCTGGIRCEMAVPVMVKRLGFKNVFQLQGGILQYFEDVGGTHWRGDCFVFDKRVGVDPDLRARPRPFCPDCGEPTHAGEEACRYCGSPEGIWRTDQAMGNPQLAHAPSNTEESTSHVLS